MGQRGSVAAPQTAETLNELNDVAFVRNMRVRVIDSLMDEKTGELPTDPKALQMLTDQLDSMDRSALTRMRIKTDATKNDLTAGMQRAVAEMLLNMSNQGVQLVPGGVIENATRMLTLPDDIEGSREYIEGETTIGSNNTTYDEFSKKHLIKPEIAKPTAAPL